MQQADGGPVRQVGGRLVAASLAAAVVVALGLSLPAGHAQPATPAGAQALIAALEMPRIANVSFDCRVSSEMLDEAATPDALAAEAAALRQRTEAGEATASEWGRLAQICAQLHQGNQERAARQRAIELYRWRLETEPDSPAALSGLAEQLVHVFGWEEAEELLRSALASDPDYWPAYPLLAEALMWQSVPWTHSIAPAAVQAFTEEFAARGYSPDTLPPAAVVDEVLSELPPLEETDAAQLVTNLAAGLVSPEATDAAREAAARGRAWLEGARGRFRDRLAAEANRDAFAAWVRTELTMAMSSMGGLAAAAAAGAETPDFAADPGAAVRIVAGLQSDELLAAAQRICEQYPDDLPLRGLLGSLQALRLWADMLVRATETEAATVDAAARERAVEARDNLTPALALPGEQPVSLVVNVCAMNYLLEDLAPVEQTASTALDQGQWDWALASLYLLARLGYGPSRWADEGHPLDGHEAELPALAGELSRWVDAAQPSEPEPYGTIASLLWRGGDEAGAIKASGARARACSGRAGVHLRSGHRPPEGRPCSRGRGVAGRGGGPGDQRP